jgi:aspartate kinase
MIVMKFGGTSVADAHCLAQVAELVLAARAHRPLVVLSAMAKATDQLFRAAQAAERGDEPEALAAADAVVDRAFAAARELLAALPDDVGAALSALRDELHVLLRGTAMLRQLSARTNDAIVAHGERLATAVLAAELRRRGAPVRQVDAREILRTDDRFGAACPQRDAIGALCEQRVAPLLEQGLIVVTEGYVGATAQGQTTTLGRGGSDWTAALLGAALGAGEVQIWTDVEGVQTADPRVVPAARMIPTMTFAEAAELAAFGAKVLHPATIQPALEAGIPVTVRHTMRPHGAFTQITAAAGPRSGVTALASRGPVTVLTMTSNRMLEQSGYLARLFAVFGELGISVDLVATAEVAVSCTVEADAPLPELVRRLAEIAAVEVATERALVAVVGERLRRSPRVLERTFAALGDLLPELVSMGGNEINLSFVVPHERAAEAVRRLHAAFFEEAKR